MKDKTIMLAPRLVRNGRTGFLTVSNNNLRIRKEDCYKDNISLLFQGINLLSHEGNSQTEHEIEDQL